MCGARSSAEERVELTGLNTVARGSRKRRLSRASGLCLGVSACLVQRNFDKRKVELGGCARPYGTPCQREHACIRCPMLNINPKMLFRLDEIEKDLLDRRARAEREDWLGEIEGIDLTLGFLRQKRERTERLARIVPASSSPTMLTLEPPPPKPN